ncbi:YfhO family protein [Treponema pectinovorum]|uniref:YfhO family protein n=1 Tax=Treponema pectinovorum TaxID=164 RepID=UPI0011C9727A|nr:YfhO family protein [Treponema pectinovorum]
MILNYITCSLFANEKIVPTLKGLELSKKIEAELKKNQFFPQKMQLSITGADEFAYNLILDLSFDNSNEIQNEKKIIFCVKQNDFYSKSKEFIDFFKSIESQKLNFPVQFVLTALDNQNEILRGYNRQLEGTKNFAESLEENKDCAVILLNFDDLDLIKRAKIYTTGGNKSTPLGLTREIVESFYKTGTDFIISQKILSLYRASLLEGDEQLEYFLKRSIPCIKISFAEDDDFSSLNFFIKNHDPSKKTQGDVHYFFFAPTFKNFFANAIWLDERFNIICLEIFGIAVLLFLVCFTFSGKKRTKTKRVFSRFWFLLPIFLFLSIISLYVSQALCLIIKPIGSANPVSQFAFKIIFSSVFVAILFLFQTKLKLPTNNFLYGFMLTVTAILNVFIFSTLDITLFWTFALEYLIVYLSRNFYRIRALIFSAFLMLLPFLPYILVYFSNVNSTSVKFLIDANPSTNIMLCLILFPFQIMWFRVLLRIRTTKLKSKDFKTLAKYTALSLFITLVFVFTFAYLTTKFIFNKSKKAQAQISFIDEKAENLSVEENFKDLAQMSYHSLSIFSKEQALRYSVTVTSPQANPILDCFYDFSVTDNPRTAIIAMPDYPPQEITIDFSTEKNTDKLFTIVAIYETDTEGVFKRESVSKHFLKNDEIPLENSIR